MDAALAGRNDTFAVWLVFAMIKRKRKSLCPTFSPVWKRILVSQGLGVLGLLSLPAAAPFTGRRAVTWQDHPFLVTVTV